LVKWPGIVKKKKTINYVPGVVAMTLRRSGMEKCSLWGEPVMCTFCSKETEDKTFSDSFIIAVWLRVPTEVLTCPVSFPVVPHQPQI
jgi:hypothetical protein